VVGRAPALLARPGVALGAVAAALGAWDALAHRLPAFHDRWDIALIAVLILPATFLLVRLLLPYADDRRVLVAAGVSAVAAVCCDLAGFEAGFNAMKIVTYAAFGFVFLQLFEALSWVVLVALIIPVVDIVSVYQGPTRVVVEEEPGIFEWIAVSFSLPGEDAAARLGPPDIVFFALFLAAAARFGLRTTATWVAMTVGVSATLVATYVFDLDGLPALPAVALGFLVPNADLLWHVMRSRDAAPPRPG
jgi:hypothetical protein